MKHETVPIAALKKPFVLDLTVVFDDFDDGKKGWLSMQDVQAATLALCGFWPRAEVVLPFFYLPKNTDTASGESVQESDKEWKLRTGEYFRVKSPYALQMWLLEAAKTIESESQVKETKRPPPIIGTTPLGKTCTENTVTSSKMDFQNEHALFCQDDQVDRNELNSFATTQCGSWTWEELFDLWDADKKNFLTIGDLVQAHSTLSVKSAFISEVGSPTLTSLEQVTGALIEIMKATSATETSEIIALSANNKTIGPSITPSGITRRQFLHFVKEHNISR